MKNTFKRGFTLVELLVVVLIIGILSSVALPQYTKAVKKAKGVKITTATSALVKAMNMAYLEDGVYNRGYHSYTGNDDFQGGQDNFDIEIPRVHGINNACWWAVRAEPYGNRTARVIADNGCSGDDYFQLIYHLSDGKLNNITCSGGGCKYYFPGTMLSSN